MTARECAFVSLKRYQNSQKYLNIEADTTIRRMKLEGAEKGLYTALLYGTVERQITLDWYLSHLCDRPLEQIDENVLIILRMSLYQLRFLDRVPDYAILNDAAELTKRFAAQSAVSFVNGVLRNAQRKEEAFLLPKREEDWLLWISVMYSQPRWLCELWQNAYGAKQTERLFQCFDHIPPITLRVNSLHTDRETVLTTLAKDAIQAKTTSFSAWGIKLGASTPIEKLTGLGNGDYFIQDESSQLCAEVFGAMPGETVLDACACPGGKSFSIAMHMENKGNIDSFDLHKNKLSLIEKGAKALGITTIFVAEQNGSVFVPALEEKYDRVLCDVPCSGLGVLSKKPDIRHKSPEEINRLPKVQSAILENCSRYVKHGGILQYSTCTLNPAENEDVINAFLSTHPDFQAEPFSIQNTPYSNGMVTLFPDRFGCDGFFAAKMRRI